MLFNSRSKAAAKTPEGLVVLERTREGWVLYEGPGLSLLPRRALQEIMTHGTSSGLKTQ
jgi:hypothetical protein